MYPRFSNSSVAPAATERAGATRALYLVMSTGNAQGGNPSAGGPG